MLIGYMRVSKADGSQTLDLQRDALLAAGVEPGHLYEDQASGKRGNGPGLEACLKAIGSQVICAGSKSKINAVPDALYVRTADRPQTSAERSKHIRAFAWIAAFGRVRRQSGSGLGRRKRLHPSADNWADPRK